MSPAKSEPAFAPPPEEKETKVHGRVTEVTRRPSGGMLVRLDNGTKLEVPRGLADDGIARGAWLRRLARGGAAVELRIGRSDAPEPA